MKRFLFYFLSLTWGLPLTLVGAVVSAALIICGKKGHLCRGCVHFEAGKNWGGVNLGLFFITNEGASSHIKNHEYGHAVQNCILGPLMPILISIPSAVRYHYRKRRKCKTAYEDIWFEKWATKLGK
ncbi:MAG: hypothetical protein IJC81_00335 [Clostridia bacterium]|nr:hypothetical protein [Clostridia bacterium]